VEAPITLRGKMYADVAASVGIPKAAIGKLREELREELAACTTPPA
jgi:hypothetical protein